MSIKPENKRKIRTALWRIGRGAAIAAVVIGAVFLVRAVLNKAFLANYNAGTYAEFPENLLATFPIGESYIAPYNEGNVLYHLGRYDRAAQYYSQALRDKNIPKERECSIRVNMALALCHTIDWDSLNLQDQDAVNNAVQTLLLARNYLTEKGCAVELAGVSGGHSKEAEKLKADIDRMLEKLMQNQNSRSSSDSSDSNSGSSSSDSEGTDSSASGSESQDQTDEEKQEQERQEALERALDDQKEELNGDDVTITDDEGHVYSYKEGGSTQGYGEGTPW